MCLVKAADGDTKLNLIESDVSLDDLQSQLHTQQVYWNVYTECFLTYLQTAFSVCAKLCSLLMDQCHSVQCNHC